MAEIYANRRDWMKFIKVSLLAISLTLGVPALTEASEVTVKKGDTLWKYGKTHGIPYQDIMKANGLSSDLIIVGQKLTIPDSKTNVSAAQNSGTQVTGNEMDTLASLVTAEAKGESHVGKVAVAAVVLNRVNDGQFPNSITGVIYQRGQFSPVANGSINNAPAPGAYQAVKEAMNGHDPTNGAVYFYNPRIASDNWIRTRPVTAVIDNHKFAK